jgi:Phytanoyl-CoA dioxygenase (PhyH)
MPALIAAAAATAVSVLAILLYPIAHHLSLPPDYPGRVTAHPASPHTPPRFPLPADDIASFRRDGFVVLRGILPADLAAHMVIAGDDLLANRTRHCELTKLTGPPIFHAYDRYCGRAHLIHDYLRDIVYQSPLAHVASQLLLSSSSEQQHEPQQQQPIVRLWADVFMAGAQLPKRWHSDFLSFSKFARRDKTTNAAVNCQQGLVFWMPLETSYAERNGLLLYNQSSTHFADYFRDHPARVHNFFSYWQWLQRHRPQDNDDDDDANNVVAPTLELSDVIAFDACCLHTSSGKYPTVGAAGGGQGGGMVMRRAYQLRFMTDFELNPVAASSSSTTGWWQRLLFPISPILPVASPQLWPHTLAEEDAIRAAGHVIYTKADWVRRLTRGPVYTLVSCALALRTRLWGDAGESESAL